jgi:hypothetical protein
MYEDVDEALAQWVEAYHVNINIRGDDPPEGCPILGKATS